MTKTSDAPQSGFKSLCRAVSRIRQHLDLAVEAQGLVQQFEKHVQAAEAPRLAHLAESRQEANLPLPTHLCKDDEPTVGLLEDYALLHPLAVDQLFERRDRNRVFGNPLHSTSTVECEWSAPVDPDPFVPRPLLAPGRRYRVAARRCSGFVAVVYSSCQRLVQGPAFRQTRGLRS